MVRAKSKHATTANRNRSRMPRAFFHRVFATTPAKPRPRPKATRPPKISAKPVLNASLKGSSVREKSATPMTTETKPNQRMLLTFGFGLHFGCCRDEESACTQLFLLELCAFNKGKEKTSGCGLQ